MAKRKAKKPKILVGHVDCDPADLPEGIIYAPGRDPDALRRVSDDVEVTDDPHLLAWTRQAYEADIDHRFALALEQVRSGDWVYLESRTALQQRPDRAAQELRRIMGDEGMLPLGRARAAEMLSHLGRPEGDEFLVASLESSQAELRTAALQMLGEWECRIDLTRPAIAAKIVNLLSAPAPEIVKQALHLCAWRKVPGAEEGVRAALANGQEPRAELAETLARLATKPESIQAALPHLFRRKQKGYTSINFEFQQVIDHPDPAITRPFRQAMQHYLLTYPEQVRLNQHWADDLASVADESVLPILEAIVARAKDPVSRAYALKALARLEPDRAIERVLAEIKRHRPWQMLIAILEQYAGEADFKRIASVLYPPKGKRRQLNIEDARLLLEKLGQPGQDLLQQNLDRLEEHAREWVTWKLQGLDVRQALVELHAAGVIAQTPLALLKEMRTQKSEEEDSLDTTHSAMLTLALSHAGLLTSFDTETGFVPCHHEELIQEFADQSGGKFKPECPIQLWHRQGEDDYDSPFTVQFIYRGQLYRFGAENFGDYYDVEAVVRALNTALKRNGQPERYLGLYTGGQCACFVFADPTAFLPIAQKYGLPLSQDASEGMRAGRAFEKKIFESENDSD